MTLNEKLISKAYAAVFDLMSDHAPSQDEAERVTDAIFRVIDQAGAHVVDLDTQAPVVVN